MKRYGSLLVSIVVIVTLTSLIKGHPLSSLRAQSFDFSEHAPKEKDRSVSDLLKHRKTLWRGQAEYLQLETAMLDNKLLLLSATSTTLRMNHGNELNLLNTDVEKRISGKILYLDTHTLPRRESIVLATVTYLTGDRLKTTVYVVRSENDELTLNDFTRTNWNMIRPVGDWMMSQRYDPEDLWIPPIYFLKTQQSGYQRKRETNLPDPARLMSLVRLSDSRWIYLNSSGALVLTKGEESLSTIKGDFGATPNVLRPIRNSWKRQNQKEPVRLNPQLITSRNLLAVMENPRSSSGFLSWFTRHRTPSFIRLFKVEEKTLSLRHTIGPFNRNVFDVEVSPANPHQLLWLRRTIRGNVVLEMLDLNDL